MVSEKLIRLAIGALSATLLALLILSGTVFGSHGRQHTADYNIVSWNMTDWMISDSHCPLIFFVGYFSYNCSLASAQFYCLFLSAV